MPTVWYPFPRGYGRKYRLICCYDGTEFRGLLRNFRLMAHYITDHAWEVTE